MSDSPLKVLKASLKMQEKIRDIYDKQKQDTSVIDDKIRDFRYAIVRLEDPPDKVKKVLIGIMNSCADTIISIMDTFPELEGCDHQLGNDLACVSLDIAGERYWE